MKKKRKSRHTSKMVYIIPILVIIIVAIWAALMTSETKPLKVSDLLQITPTIALAESTSGVNNDTIKIMTLGLNITAIGGDAHSIILIISSHQDPDGVPVKPFLPKGESWGSGDGLPLEYLTYPSRLNEDGLYPVEVSIGCEEADEHEDIMLYLKPENVLIIPGSSSGY